MNLIARDQQVSGLKNVLSSDLNGFAPQLWLPAEDVVYPVNAARLYGKPTAPLLDKDQLGDRVFSFQKDGIAHYGMLPDFLQAVSQQPDSLYAMDSLFHSAEAVVNMWKKCQSSGAKLAAGSN